MQLDFMKVLHKNFGGAINKALGIYSSTYCDKGVKIHQLTKIKLGPRMNDLWRYQMNDSAWAWISGSNTVNQPNNLTISISQKSSDINKTEPSNTVQRCTLFIICGSDILPITHCTCILSPPGNSQETNT